MEQVDVEAIYERGTLRLPVALPLDDGQKVTITIHSTNGKVMRRRALIQWKGSRQDLEYLLGPDNHPWAEDE